MQIIRDDRMNSRKWIRPIDELLDEGIAISTKDPESKYLFRVAMVNLMLAGMPAKDLAKYSGVSARALAAWREKADIEGFDSLKASKQAGRPAVLSDSQIAEIKDVLNNNPDPPGTARGQERPCPSTSSWPMGWTPP